MLYWIWNTLLTGALSLNVEDARNLASNLVSQMTLEEKISMMSGDRTRSTVYTGQIPGVERLGIPLLYMSDGPQGFRTNKDSIFGTTTAWPCALSVASSWDAELSGLWGETMASEFRQKGTNVQLGPGIGIARVPTAGRNFEYLCGEEPMLCSKLVQPIIKGIQSQGIIANAKHYVNNEMEDHRQTVSSDVDVRTRFELYYPPFQAAVEAGVLSVMCAYNRVNDVHACENSETLGHLKNELGFTDGWVMSDWMATHSTNNSMIAGLDQEMPVGLHYSQKMMQAALSDNSSHVSVDLVDASVTRILTAMGVIGMLDTKYYEFPTDYTANVSTSEHKNIAREMISKSAVLLVNSGVLPLSAGSMCENAGKVAVIGDSAIVSGGGSGSVTPSHIVTLYEGILNQLNAVSGCRAQVSYNDGVDVNSAVKLASASDFIFINVATTSEESEDRESLALGNGQDELVSAIVASAGDIPVIVNVIAPGAVLLPWSSSVDAVLLSFLPGEQMGNGVADILFGIVNPSGRLPVTIPNKDNEVDFSIPQYPGVGPHPYGKDVIYSERLNIGYRWYDQHAVSPLFPFGFGLSYTTFEYSDIVLRKQHISLSPNILDVILMIDVTVANSGDVDGASIAQLYVSYPEVASEPVRLLKGFEKVWISAGQSAKVSFSLTYRDLSVWDVKSNIWRIAGAANNLNGYRFYVGTSSRNLLLEYAL